MAGVLYRISRLIVRDTARGVHRFDALQQELGVSRKVLTERPRLLVDAGVLAREPYQDRPVRHEYRLTPRGRALLPVLIALQDWGDTWVLGEGETTATTTEASREAARVRALKGTRLPELLLTGDDGEPRDPVAGTPYTVLYCFPSAYARRDAYPPGWAGIPGARGCTLESCTYRDGSAEFTAALRLPTFRTAGVSRLRRLTLVVGRERTIRKVLYPITDIGVSVREALEAVRRPADRVDTP